MITLQSLKLSDLDLMKEWMLDKEVTRFFRFSSYEESKVVDFIKQSWTDAHNKHFAIRDESDTYLGTISLKNIDEINHHAEYAIVIRKNFWGKGIGKQASQLLIDYALQIGLHKVYLNVLASNETAIQLYLSLGFEKAGVYRDHLYRSGQYYDLIYFEKILGGNYEL